MHCRSHECDREHTEINVGHLRKGKLKLVKTTFINRYFLAKERVVAGGKICYFCLMLPRQVLSLHYFMHC